MHESQRLTVDLPVELHRNFKIWCVLNGKKMNDVIRELLRDALHSSQTNSQLNKHSITLLDRREHLAKSQFDKI